VLNIDLNEKRDQIKLSSIALGVSIEILLKLLKIHSCRSKQFAGKASLTEGGVVENPYE